MSEPTRGVILIALGNPFYGYLASNLAASISYTAKGLPIYLVTNPEAISMLTEAQRGLFSTIKICPEEYYKRGEKVVYIKAKTHLYDLSPFDETIFLDVDTIMLSGKSLWNAFEDLKEIDFTMENRGRVNLAESSVSSSYLWAKVSDIKKEYKTQEGFLYGLHSEFIYWKKNARISAFFETVKNEFLKPKCEVVKFDGDLPDEFAFAMAMLQHKLYPHQCPYKPLYWFLTDKALGSSLSYCLKNYYGYSVGGNATPENVRRIYDQLTAAYSQRLNLPKPFRLRQKRQILASRTIM